MADETCGLVSLADVPGLVERYHGPLLTFATRQVGWSAAEEIVQDGWVRFLAALQAGAVVDIARVQGYLYQIVNRLLLDWHRHHQRTQRLGFYALEMWEPTLGYTGPEERVAGREVLLQALERCSVRDQWLFVLHQMGYPYHQIARAVGMNMQAVKQRAYRARQALATWYAKEAS